MPPSLRQRNGHPVSPASPVQAEVGSPEVASPSSTPADDNAMNALARAWQLLIAAGMHDASEDVRRVGMQRFGEDRFQTALDEAVFTA